MREEEYTLLGELKEALGENAPEDSVLTADIDKYLNQFGIEYARAKAAIIKKFTGGGNKPSSGFATSAAVVKKIGELNGSEPSITMTVRVVYAEKRDTTIKGEPRTIVTGIIGDETGTCSFTVWDGKSTELEKGAVYTFKNVYAKTWNERIQINVGSRGSITSAPAGTVIDVPDRVIAVEAQEVKIGDIKDGMGSVSVTGRIMSVEARRITTTDKNTGESVEKTVHSGVIADDSGKIQFSAWTADFPYRAGDSVNIKNAYIRSWKSIPQLNIGDRGEVTKVDDSFEIPDNEPSARNLAELVARGGALDVAATGTVVDLRQGSGLIQRCPQCNRSILNSVCTAHGTVDPVLDLRMKMVVDDGTAAISTVVGREDTERLTGITLEKAKEIMAAKGGFEGVAREMAAIMIMKRVTVRGNLMNDDFGPNMIVRGAEIATVDVTAEAKRLYDEVEAAL